MEKTQVRTVADPLGPISFTLTRKPVKNLNLRIRRDGSVAVSAPDQAAAMAQAADGVIVGSAIVRLAQQYGREAAPHLRAFTAEMKAAVSGVR